ncbi:MAG: phosphoglucomutase/phosphomannomutase family protein, partial [Chloroflexi bacterium]|nr:phosphoglucomutase/phosphomannomutase family protein [Chloroflexota bacterium]
MPPSRIAFGTDGWRGRMADDYTYASVRRCAQGFARYLLETEGDARPVVVGYDKRFSSEHFAAAAAEVLAGGGLRVLLTDGPTPTPAISYAVRHHQACGAVNITASHNPPEDNGFKVRNRFGGAIDPAGLKRIEALIPPDDDQAGALPIAGAISQGRLELFDAAPAYIEQLKRLVDLEPLRDAPLTLVVDAMWGNGGGWFPRLLGGGRLKIIEIHNTRNPSFPEMSRP